ncbi:hypothetical protein DPEC_G00299620 [Dallia pectoralis]|uniref:Uncharacterized protein n=1 Tax=Dallia pectoralis TaxID=75939 RepID=A0ACC2FG85_DALPE|nr:hypothetical protein DPEC_G00299620 [Dallia pectoralis]
MSPPHHWRILCIMACYHLGRGITATPSKNAGRFPASSRDRKRSQPGRPQRTHEKTPPMEILPSPFLRKHRWETTPETMKTPLESSLSLLYNSFLTPE